MLEIKNLSVHFPVRGGILNRVLSVVKAVDDLSIKIEEGEAYGLVGESGCGKTTTGRSIVGLNKITSGSIFYNGDEITSTIKKNNSPIREHIQMIFQDPYSSLNSQKTLYQIVAEPLRNFGNRSEEEIRKRVLEMTLQVGISEDALYKYPHEFSGGQRQRIGIARALTLNPAFIVADEAVSALDVSIQAQVINYMEEMQGKFNLTYLFISHDLNVVKHLCSKIGIMHKGRIVEEGTVEDIFENPQHIYTKKLLSSIPTEHPRDREKVFKFRKEVAKLHKETEHLFYDESGRPYDLKEISPTHKVAIKEVNNV